MTLLSYKSEKLRKAFKIIIISFIGFVAFLTVIGTLFIKLSPQFGGEITSEQQQEYELLDYYSNGKFQNIGDVKMTMGLKKGIEVTYDFLKKDPKRTPAGPLPLLKLDSTDIVNLPDSLSRLTWFGHSAFLLELEGLKILLDPMLGPVPAPHPWLGTPRYNDELPITIEKMPKIDAVIISHDHYDHLDYESIMKLKNKVNHFYAPLGVGAHLRSWGIAAERVHELKWWDETTFMGLKLACTPSQHFSGRGLFDRAATLWSSWVIKSKGKTIFFSGDGGYGDHFKEIGAKYGPFDISMLECGQYNENWKEIHMMPEQTAQAGVDLNSKVIVPIHWAAFTLSLHSWTDPVERVTLKAQELSLPVTTPRIGQPILLDQAYPMDKWWVGH